MKYTAVLALLSTIFFISCQQPVVSVPAPETFADADKPVFAKDPSGDFWFMKPWNYDKLFNSDRQYPLLVGLYGAGASSGYAPCIVWSNEEKQKYPCFILSPHTTSSSWDGDTATQVIELIEQAKSRYRIDPNRIYLMGFSMGGSGSYSVANTYWDLKKRRRGDL